MGHCVVGWARCSIALPSCSRPTPEAADAGRQHGQLPDVHAGSVARSDARDCVDQNGHERGVITTGSSTAPEPACDRREHAFP